MNLAGSPLESETKICRQRIYFGRRWQGIGMGDGRATYSPRKSEKRGR